MNCNDITDLLSAYIDGELNEDEGRLVAAHLDTCLKCKKQLAALKKTVSMVKNLDEIEVPAELSHSLRQIAQSSPSPARDVAQKTSQRTPALRYLIVATAIAAIALITLLPFAFKEMERVPSDKDMSALQEDSKQSAKSVEQAQKAPEAKSDATYSDKEGSAAQALRGSPAPLQSTPKPEASTAGSWPQVEVTDKNYDEASAEKLLANIKNKTEDLYIVRDAKDKHDVVMNSLVEKLNAKGIKGELMRSPVNASLTQTKRAALPVYLEKAKFAKKDCWLLIIRWGFGGDKGSLYKASLYVTDPSGWTTYYYASM